MTSYQVDDRDQVELFDNNTRGLIINCTKLAVADMRDGNSDECEFINCRESVSLYGEWAKAIKFDDMPSPREVKRDAVAFVQYASSIASALEKGKKAVVFCKNGRSRSPCVVAAFYIIYRGLPLREIKMWFKELYPKQRPITAAKSSSFPNIEKFEAVLNLLERCLANPEKTVRGFNLADIVAECSKAHVTRLQLAGSIKLDHLDYYSVPPTLRQVVFTSKSDCHSPVGVLTREARRKEVEAVSTVGNLSEFAQKKSVSKEDKPQEKTNQIERQNPKYVVGENDAGKKSPKGICASPVAVGVDNWAEIWKIMQTQGWDWISGDGLVDWYYVHPNFANRGKSEIMKNGKEGKDYFQKEAAMRYAKKNLGFRGEVATPASDSNETRSRKRTATVAAAAEPIKKKKEKKNSKAGKKQSDEESKKEVNDTKGEMKTDTAMYSNENESISDCSHFSKGAGGGGFIPNSPTMREAEADIGVANENDSVSDGSHFSGGGEDVIDERVQLWQNKSSHSAEQHKFTSYYNEEAKGEEEVDPDGMIAGAKKMEANTFDIDTKLAPHQFCERLCLVKSASDSDFAFTPGRVGPDQTVSVNKLWPALKFTTFNELMDQRNLKDADPMAINKVKDRVTVEVQKLVREAGISLSDAGFAYLLGKGNQSSNFLLLLKKNDSGELIEDGVIFDFFDSVIEMEDTKEGYCATPEFQHAYKIAMTRMEEEESGDDVKPVKVNNVNKKTSQESREKTKFLMHNENESVSDGSHFSRGGLV